MAAPGSFVDALLADEESAFQEVMEAVALSDGEVLFERGDSGDAFYVIESGQVRIYTRDEEDNELTLNMLDAGEAFGELSLLDGRPRSASVAGVGQTTLRRLSRDDFLSRVHTSRVLTDHVVQLLIQRTRHMTDYIGRLGQWARLIAEGQYDEAMQSMQAEDASDRALAAVGDAVRTLVQAVQAREEELRDQVAQLRIEIDERKRQEHVAEITETDYFQDLTQQADDLRKRREARRKRR